MFNCTLQMGNQKLDAALLPEQGNERIHFALSLPTATVQRWSSPQEAAELCRNNMSVLCLPHAKNEPTFDAISSPCLYWQVSPFLSAIFNLAFSADHFTVDT